MKIRKKLTFGPMGLVIFVGLFGVISINVSQKALQKAIGSKSVASARTTIENISRNIHNRVEQSHTYSLDNTHKDIHSLIN